MRAQLAVVAALLVTLTACGSTENTPVPETSASASAALSSEEAAQACTDAVYDADSAAREAGTDADWPMPTECTHLDPGDYVDIVFAVNQQLNKNARDELERQAEEAKDNQQ
ncbi:hypothetical protein ACFXKG_18465 [Streptomyces sp. NPDC059255]|uniref:hypothetical protein n=1 Tax=Streptomyces sp. NPDC059255 TaxID=3346793 RepID=UPI00367B16D1